MHAMAKPRDESMQQIKKVTSFFYPIIEKNLNSSRCGQGPGGNKIQSGRQGLAGPRTNGAEGQAGSEGPGAEPGSKGFRLEPQDEGPKNPPIKLQPCDKGIFKLYGARTGRQLWRSTGFCRQLITLMERGTGTTSMEREDAVDEVGELQWQRRCS